MNYQKWQWLMTSVNACFYVAIILTIFFLVPNFEAGHVVPWTLAIISGILLFTQALFITYHVQKLQLKRKIIPLLLGASKALIMAVLSVLDMITAGNHAVSKVLFLVIPLVSLLVNANYAD